MKKLLTLISLSSASLLLVACGNNATNETESIETESSIAQSSEMVSSSEVATRSVEESESTEEMDMHMEHSGEVPADMVIAEKPEFNVGDEVTILADHMPGMEGAQGEVTGAYETLIYAVTYTDTNTGELVKNHKWVVREEVDNPAYGLEAGDEVGLLADHMPGMKGAKATIDEVIDGVIYTVTYTDTNTGELVEDHMWVIGDELQAR
ncbi:YdhK family protein [Dolosicoccus paucivorans]